MLKAIAWLLLIPGSIAFVVSLVGVFAEPTAFTIGLSVGVFVAAFLTPATLFALAEIVQYTRETRDAVRVLSDVASYSAATELPQSVDRSTWGQAVAHLVEAQEAGERARARQDNE